MASLGGAEPLAHTKLSLQASGSPAEPLGAFRKLPPEVRFSIWEHLMPKGQCVVGDPMKFKETTGIFKRWFDLRFDGNGHGLVAILQASLQLYNEISNQLYYKRELCFQFGMGGPPPGLMTWPLRDLPGAFRGHFLFANFARFSRIIFEIETPTHVSLKGPLALRSRIRNVVETISDLQQYFVDVGPSISTSCPPRSASLPEIHIVFTEDAFARMSIKLSDRHQRVQHEVSEQVARSIISSLECFRGLRRSKRVTIELPKMVQDDKSLRAVVNSHRRRIQSSATIPLLAKGRCNTLFLHFSKLAEEERKPPLRYYKWRKWYLTRLRQTLGLSLCYPWPGYSTKDESEYTLDARPGRCVDGWGNAMPEWSGQQPREVWII